MNGEDEKVSDFEKFGIFYAMLSPNIPYKRRWQILNLKLMLNDIYELWKKHGIDSSEALYETVKNEIDYMLKQFDDGIKYRIGAKEKEKIK